MGGFAVLLKQVAAADLEGFHVSPRGARLESHWKLNFHGSGRLHAVLHQTRHPHHHFTGYLPRKMSALNSIYTIIIITIIYTISNRFSTG